MIRLDDSHRAAWAESRWVRLESALDADERADVARWVAELAEWPETPGRWMKYFERTAGNRQLCRVENFLPYHEGLRGLLERADLRAVLAELMGEPAVLFKEKINYKLPGGEGFAPHQDAPAFTSFDQRYHVTLMISVDPTTPENGGLEIVDGFRREETLAQEADGTLAGEVVDGLDWHPLETRPGDVVLFDSYVPHRSGPNRSGEPRRALYVTYNRASEGDRRADYFARKRRAFPPECERDPDRPLDPEELAVFNLGNPIR